MAALKIILLVLQLIACVALTVIVLFQNGKDNGLSALTGSSDTYLGKGKSASMEAKLSRATKWVAGVFVLLTLFLAMLYTAF